MILIRIEKNLILLSIIIPFYNVSPYFKECLESLLAEDFLGLELICVDDASTDNSLQILNSFKNKFHCLKVLNNSNKGAGEARNLGLKEARGEYVFFMDADDALDSKFSLKENLRFAASNRLDILIFEAVFWDCKNSYKRIPWCFYKNNLPQKLVFSSEDVSKRLFQITGTEIWNKFYRRDFLLKNKVKFQNLPNANDVYFSFFSLSQAKRMACLPKVALKYRIHNNSTQAVKKKDPTCILTAIEALREDLNLMEPMNKEILISFQKWVLGVLHFNFRTLRDEKALLILLERAKTVIAELQYKDLSEFDKKQRILLSYLQSKDKVPKFILTRELMNPTVTRSNYKFFPFFWILLKVKNKFFPR